MDRPAELSRFLDNLLEPSEKEEVTVTMSDLEAESEEADDAEEDDEIQILGTFPKKRTRLLSQLQLEPMRQKAMKLYYAEQHEEALQSFQDIVTECPNDEQAFIAMSNCCEALGKFPKALAYLKSALTTLTGKINPYVWKKLYNMAEAAEDEDEQCRCLKALVQLKALPDDEKMGYLTVLINSDFLTDKQKIWYQEELYKLCEKQGHPSTFYQAVTVARGYLAQNKMTKAIAMLEGHLELEFAFKQGQETPKLDLVDAVAVHLEALVKLGKMEEVIPFLSSHEIIQNATQIFVDSGYLNVQNKGSLMAILASVCLAEVQLSKSCQRVQKILTVNLLHEKFYSSSEVYFRLGRALLHIGEAGMARDLILHIQSCIAVFRNTHMYNLLGNCYEHLHNVESAKEAYQQSLNCRQSCRDAKNRLYALSFEFPNVVPYGNEKLHVDSEAETQVKLYEEYYAKATLNKDRQSKAEVVELAKKILQSTFQHRVALNAEDFLWELKTPYILDKPMKIYRESCPAIAAKTINLATWRRIAVDGAAIAFQLEQYSDMVEISFNALRTKELHDEPEKLHEIKLAIVVAAFHLGRKHAAEASLEITSADTSASRSRNSTIEPSMGESSVNKKLRFVYDYLRGMVNAGRNGKMPVELWNLMSYLIPDRTVVLYRASVGKFAIHFMKKHEVFSVELQMIMANEALAIGTKTRARKLYLELQEKVGDDKMPWQAWLNLGVVSVQLACGKAVSRVNRAKLFDAAMKYLDKYGRARGVCQEVSYNKARAAQQFGDVKKAIKFYKECLKLQKKTDLSKLPKDLVPVVDFSYRAAFNLYGLYVGRRKYEEAREVQTKYLNWKVVRRNILAAV
ncbi:hypothetical protein RvY_10430 [Ramazzottius varieornatus]|uniref:Uncharacterized protein n=1 Tax=Ramazzottius varieornatus TaxID=947166 RepID=A0A1D1VCQ9_RAMVA|nr:hypothetical protein RvY_10430 [Ramazzottius varieornatus]